MKVKLSKNQPLLVILATVLLFGTTIAYNSLRVNAFLAKKKVFPQGIPLLKEHGQSQGKVTLETMRYQNYSDMVLGSENEEDISNTRLRILNGTEIPGLATAAKKYFAEAGFSSISIGNAPKSSYNTTLVKFRPEMRERAELIRNLIGKDLEISLSEFEKEATAEANFDFDVIVILATRSAFFDQYFSTSKEPPESPLLTE